jgi:hypothetical protein
MGKALPTITAVLAGMVITLGAVLLFGGDGDGDGGGGDDAAKPAAPRKAGEPADQVLADSRQLTGPDKAYTLRYPKGWEEVKRREKDVPEGAAISMVKRSDDKATLIVQQRGKLEQDLDEVRSDLTKQLSKEIRDFKLVRAGEVRLPAGPALSYTFVRTKSGRVQNLVVVPSNDRTYTLNAVIAPGADAAAREVAAIVRSFDPGG